MDELKNNIHQEHSATERREVFHHDILGKAFYLPDTGKLFCVTKIEPISRDELEPDAALDLQPNTLQYVRARDGKTSPSIIVPGGVIRICAIVINGTEFDQKNTQEKTFEKYFNHYQYTPGRIEEIIDPSIINDVILYPGDHEPPTQWKLPDDVAKENGLSEASVRTKAKEIVSELGYMEQIELMRSFRSPKTDRIRTYYHERLIEEIKVKAQPKNRALLGSNVPPHWEKSKDFAEKHGRNSNLIAKLAHTLCPEGYGSYKDENRVSGRYLSPEALELLERRLAEMPLAPKGAMRPEDLAKELDRKTAEIMKLRPTLLQAAAVGTYYTSESDTPHEYWSAEFAQRVREEIINRHGLSRDEIVQRYRWRSEYLDAAIDMIRETHPEWFIRDKNGNIRYSLMAISAMSKKIYEIKLKAEQKR